MASRSGSAQLQGAAPATAKAKNKPPRKQGVPASIQVGAGRSGDASGGTCIGERLKEAAERVQAELPWYEKVGVVWNGDGGSGRDIAAGTLLASLAANNLLMAANESVLAPVFVVVKGLLDAMHGAAVARKEVVELVEFCVAIASSLLDLAEKHKLPPQILMAVGEFKGEVEAVGGFVQTYGTQTGCCRKMVTNTRDRDAAAGHKRRLEGLLKAVLVGLAAQIHADVTRLLPQKPYRRRSDPAAVPCAAPSLPRSNDIPPRRVSGLLAAVPCEAPSLPRSHVPRAGMLEQIVLGLLDPRRGSPAVHGLVGMGGGGKTVLASSVVRDDRVRSNFSQGLFWMCVGQAGKDNIALLLKQLAREMAAASSNTLHTCPHGFDSAEEAERHLKEVLARNQLRCLLVLDGVWDVEVVNAFVRTGFNLLVTTRRRTVIAPAHTGMMVEIGDMSQEDALQVLGKASGAQGPLPVEAEQVARDCGMLPLALGMAGAMARRQPLQATSWRRVHEILQRRTTKLRHMQSEHETLFSTIEASANELPSSQRKQLRLMAVMASGVSATSDMLASLWQVEPSDATTGADILVDRCLLQPVKDGVEYRLHDLVLEYLQLAIKMDEDLAKFASSRQAVFLSDIAVLRSYAAGGNTVINGGMYALLALWNSAKKLDRTLSVEKYYVGSLEGVGIDDAPSWHNAAHILALLGDFSGEVAMRTEILSMAEKEEGEFVGVASALSRLAWALYEQGKFDEADTLLARAAIVAEKALGPEDPFVAALLSKRAEVLRKQGKFPEAEELYDRSEKIRPAGTPEFFNNKAVLFRSQGRLDEAALMHAKAVATTEATLGPEHPDLATCLMNQAGVLRGQGKFAEAGPICARAQEIREKAVGPDHPTVAWVLNNRAAIFDSQGKFDEGEPLHARAIAIMENTLDPNHPALASCLNDYAENLRDQGKLTKAEALSRRALEIREKNTGPDHPDMVTSLTTLGRLLERQGKLLEAEQLFRRAADIVVKTHGPKHPDLAKVLLNLASSLLSQGKYDMAEETHRRVQAIEEDTAPSGLERAAGLNNRGALLFKQAKYDEARPLFERALILFEAGLGPDHPSTLACRSWKAKVYEQQGLLEEATLVQQEIARTREHVQGRDHPDFAQALDHWATLLLQQDKLAEADPLFIQAAKINIAVFGPEHPIVARDLNNRSALLLRQGKSGEAGRMCQRAVEIHEKMYGRDHPESAAYLNNWAMALDKQGKYDQALPLLERVLTISEGAMGMNHPQTASCRGSLLSLSTSIMEQAGALRDQGKCAEAEPFFERSQAIRERLMGKNHEYTAMVLNNRAGNLYSLGRRREAISLWERALKIARETLGENHQNTIATANTLRWAKQGISLTNGP